MIENFIHENNPDTDRDLFFGPLTATDQFHVFDDTFRMDDIAVVAGLFPSKNQARKNGWAGDIPSGFTLKIFGKHRKIIAILNKF